jgi:hypothetical protein
MFKAVGYPYMHCFIVQARKLVLQFILLHLGLIFSPKDLFVPTHSTVYNHKIYEFWTLQ